MWLGSTDGSPYVPQVPGYLKTLIIDKDIAIHSAWFRYSLMPFTLVCIYVHLSHVMRLWYISHMRPAKAQASLRIHAGSPKPSLFAHMKYEIRRRVRPKIRHLISWHGLFVLSTVIPQLLLIISPCILYINLYRQNIVQSKVLTKLLPACLSKGVVVWKLVHNIPWTTWSWRVDQSCPKC